MVGADWGPNPRPERALPGPTAGQPSGPCPQGGKLLGVPCTNSEDTRRAEAYVACPGEQPPSHPQKEGPYKALGPAHIVGRGHNTRCVNEGESCLVRAKPPSSLGHPSSSLRLSPCKEELGTAPNVGGHRLLQVHVRAACPSCSPTTWQGLKANSCHPPTFSNSYAQQVSPQHRDTRTLGTPKGGVIQSSCPCSIVRQWPRGHTWP